MSDYTISYSRQKQLEKEETLLDEEVNKAKVVNQFNGTTLEKSLEELDEFVSDGSIRDWVISHPNMIVPVSFAIMLLIEGAILSLVALVVPFVTRQPANVSMLGAVFAFSMLPSLLMSASICEEIFDKQNRFERLKEKTLGSGYEISKDIIDCPISYKKLLSIWLFSEFEATYIKAVKGELLFYSEDGKLIKRGDDMTIPENHENIKKFCNADNKEKKYLTSQMIDSRFYKISDIITDVPVEHIEK